MTTIYPSRRRRVPLSRITQGAGLVILLAAAALFRAPLSSALWRVLAPALAWRTGAQTSVLEGEFASTTAALADRDALAADNVLLKKELGRDPVQRGVLALVVARPPGLPYDTLMLDAGEDHGIAAGQRVLAAGALIGEVSEAYATTARVTLFSSPGQEFPALIRGTTPVSIQGEGAGSMMGEVPAQTSVAVGDPVLFPSISSSYVGSISHIDAPMGESFESVFVQLPVDLFSLRYVFVETQP
jgi:cell shape-determining protein MreC